MKSAQAGKCSFGARPEEHGTAFSLYTEAADSVELVLFQVADDGPRVERVIDLPHRGENVFQAFVPGAGPGTAYGFRVHGAYEPAKGLRCNSKKVLLDPYAKGVLLPASWNTSLYDYATGGAVSKDAAGLAKLRPSSLDSAGSAPLAVVCGGKFDWARVPRPNVPWKDTVIYEAHVKGLTHLHPDIAPELRGTYLGLASAPIIHHLHTLGVTAIELLPVHASLSEPWLQGRGLSNFWGYNTLSFFAPDPRFATAAARNDPEAVLREFKEMVRTLHFAGIEVILDVVYNHTAEGDAFGPSVSFRGIDNRAYYRQGRAADGLYEDFTGCGNTLDASHPIAHRLILDSLRYWVEECGVDGFRLDLTSAICRTRRGDFLGDSALSFAMLQDPALREVKLIAEPWDATAEGYALGKFPAGISEWNGRYRDTVRRFWRGDEGQVPALASVLCGSSDLFESGGRTTRSTINFVTVHDGFTLNDLVSYGRKHNDKNGEHCRDGTNENYSASYGHEGPSNSAELEELRLRQMKNLLTTLFFSVGVPMILAGDEGRRTQGGNNNAYCQDNETSWIDWSLQERSRELRELIIFLTGFRRSHPILCRQQFLSGNVDPATGKKDVMWLRESGKELSPDDWADPAIGCLAVSFSDAGSGGSEESLLLLLNSTTEARSFLISRNLVEDRWQLLLRTDEQVPFAQPRTVRRGETIVVGDRTFMVFRSGRTDSTAPV